MCHKPRDALMSSQEAYHDAARQITQNMRSNQLAFSSTMNRAPCRVEFFRYSSMLFPMRILYRYP